MRSNPYFRGYTLFLLALLLVGSAASCAEGAQRLPARELSIIRGDGSSVKLSAEIADDDAERSLGLMHRKKIADGEGMLFVFESDRLLSFWMKNTLVPLSIAYIASDGRILELHDMTPLSLAPVESERSARYALEVTQGWFERSGVVVGDRLVLPEK